MILLLLLQHLIMFLLHLTCIQLLLLYTIFQICAFLIQHINLGLKLRIPCLQLINYHRLPPRPLIILALLLHKILDLHIPAVKALYQLLILMP